MWVQELELVEDVWRGEAQDLLSQIAQLQEENKSLLTNLSVKEPLNEEELQRHEGEALLEQLKRPRPGSQDLSGAPAHALVSFHSTLVVIFDQNKSQFAA